MFTEIVLHDYSKPLAQRKRKPTGPYRWTPRDASKSDGFGFYQSSKGLAMDRHGSICDLRIEEANDHVDYHNLNRITAYYCDEFGGTTFTPIIARLPHGRGFLAGWTMGRGMCASLSTYIHWEAKEAARAAHHEAERAAERERDYQAEQDMEEAA